MEPKDIFRSQDLPKKIAEIWEAMNKCSDNIFILQNKLSIINTKLKLLEHLSQ